MKLLVRKIKLAKRMVRGWVATRQARIAALHRAFALAEIDFQHELDRRRVEVEVHAIRRTSHPDSMFYDRAQALATACALYCLDGDSENSKFSNRRSFCRMMQKTTARLNANMDALVAHVDGEKMDGEDGQEQGRDVALEFTRVRDMDM